MLVAAQMIMTAKKLKTKGHDPMMLRMRSAARSPRESSSRLRTPGCRCQNVGHLLMVKSSHPTRSISGTVHGDSTTGEASNSLGGLHCLETARSFVDKDNLESPPSNAPLSEIVVLSVPHKERVAAATAVRMTNDLKRRRAFMSDYPTEDLGLNQSFSISSKVLPLVSGTLRQTKSNAATETIA